jgi:hypothetical protein
MRGDLEKGWPRRPARTAGWASRRRARFAAITVPTAAILERDGDHVLSADPSDVARRAEIGVFVESKKIADYLIQRFEHTRST